MPATAVCAPVDVTAEKAVVEVEPPGDSVAVATANVPSASSDSLRSATPVGCPLESVDRMRKVLSAMYAPAPSRR